MMSDKSGSGKPHLRLIELFGPIVDLARPQLLWLPAVAVVAGFLIGLLVVAPPIPAAGPPAWLTSLFATAAQIIATLFVALALEARYASITRAAANATVGYVAVGVLAAATGMSAALPHGLYAVLLGLTLGCGTGALFATALIAANTIGGQLAQEAQQRRAELFGDPTDLT
jgi:hypothetical protein